MPDSDAVPPGATEVHFCPLGSDGRYFGHALAEGFSPMTVLYADESAFSKIFGWWDRDGDNE